MHILSTLCLIGLAGQNALAASSQGRNHRRQDGPVDPRTASDCTYFETALDKSYDCKYYQNRWGLSAADFLDWNPSVRVDCSGIKIGNSYCVEVNNGLPRPTKPQPQPTEAPPSSVPPSPTRPGAPSPTPTGPTKPKPTQPGLDASCTAFYKAVPGDSCWAIVQNLAGGAFSLDDFYAWNPAVGDECAGLQAAVYYCVGVPGRGLSGGVVTKPTTTSKPASTTTQRPTGCTAAAPASTQPGSVCGCRRWHKVVQGDACGALERAYRISHEDFMRWNTQVGGDECGSLWLGYNVCVGM